METWVWWLIGAAIMLAILFTITYTVLAPAMGTF